MTNPWARPEDSQPETGQTQPDQAETIPLVPQAGYPQQPQVGWQHGPEPTVVDPLAQSAPYTNPTPGQPVQQQVFPTYTPPPASPYPTSEPAGTPGYAPYGQPSGFQSGQVVPTAYGYSYSYAPTQPEHPNAVPALILGIVGFFTAITWPIAWYLGARGRSEMRQQPQRWRPSPMLTAGWVLGIIGTILMLLMILFVILVVVIAIAAA